MLAFLNANRRWLGAGFLLTLASAFGQTWFIALFAGGLKAEHGLSDGGWGTLYAVATLAAAGLLFFRGELADTVPLGRLAPATALVFAAACLGMAFANSLVTLGIALFLLRFCGQGMFSHMALTAMGRWFRARRGQAVSITNLGHPAGEVLFPVVTVLAIGTIGWNATWAVAAAVLALLVAPLLALLLAEGRQAQSREEAGDAPGLGARHWTRGEALGHWLLPALLPTMLTPPFVGTVVFFHQVHIAEVKGWTLAGMATGYTVFATLTVASALLAGWAADRFGPHRLLAAFLLPAAFGVALIGPANAVGVWVLALGLIGVTQGIAGALWGTLLPFLYGTRNLGSVRSMVTTIMVVSTAIGPALTGLLIDRGIAFPAQAMVLGLWCLGLSAAGFLVQRRIEGELARLPG